MSVVPEWTIHTRTGFILPESEYKNSFIHRLCVVTDVETKRPVCVPNYFEGVVEIVNILKIGSTGALNVVMTTNDGRYTIPGYLYGSDALKLLREYDLYRGVARGNFFTFGNSPLQIKPLSAKEQPEFVTELFSEPEPLKYLSFAYFNPSLIMRRNTGLMDDDLTFATVAPLVPAITPADLLLAPYKGRKKVGTLTPSRSKMYSTSSLMCTRLAETNEVVVKYYEWYGKFATECFIDNSIEGIAVGVSTNVSLSILSSTAGIKFSAIINRVMPPWHNGTPIRQTLTMV